MFRVLSAKVSQNQYLLQWNKHTKPYKTYGCTLQLCSWWWVQIAPETCRAHNVVKNNKEYEIHLVGLESNIPQDLPTYIRVAGVIIVSQFQH
jgi:hypothetical protein